MVIKINRWIWTQIIYHIIETEEKQFTIKSNLENLGNGLKLLLLEESKRELIKPNLIPIKLNW